jgi:hypothetical protein
MHYPQTLWLILLCLPQKYIYEGWFVNIKLINFLNVFVIFLVKKMNITFKKYSQQKKSFHIMQHE